MRGGGADINFYKCENDPSDDKKKIFYFKIRCNKMFSERVFLREEILEVNMLCRPCLIKLNGKYHLREQKLPFFITLAHEFLHALNQLECIQKISLENVKLDIFVTKNSIEFYKNLDSIKPIQTFLCEKLEIEKNSTILKEECTKLWQNDDVDDSLDEMSVILGSNRKIGDNISTFIGETTFLQEYFGDNSIISWSHNGAHDYEFYREGMNILLESEYVECVLNAFYGNIPELSNITQRDNGAEVVLVAGGRREIKSLNKNTEAEVKKDLEQPKIVRLKRKNSTIFQFVLYPPLKDVKLLPIVSKAKTTLKIPSYTIIDVPADGNCAFTSVKVAMDDEEFKDKFEGNLIPNQLDAIIALREATADKMGKDITGQDDFIENLRQLGYWNSGIDEGGVGIKVLSFVAEVIKQPILVIKQEPNSKYYYWVSGTAENYRDGNLAFHDIEKKDLEGLLNDHPDAIKLFHNGVYFQALCKTTIGLGGTASLPLPPLTSVLSGRLNRDIIPAPDPFTVSSEIGTPPHSTERPETIPVEFKEKLAGYQIQNVPEDGNCGVWAVLVAAGEITLGELGELMDAYESLKKEGYSPNWKDCGEILEKASEKATTTMINFRKNYNLGEAGDWIREEHLPQLSEVLEKPIVVVYAIDGLPVYTLYSSTERHGKVLEEKTIEEIMTKYSGAIFIYFDGVNHFQAVVPR